MNAIVISEAGLGARSVFEQIFELIDKHTEKLDQEKFPLGDFYEIVTEFDDTFKAFNSNTVNIENIDFLNDLLEKKIGSIVLIFEVFGFRESPIFFAFKRFLSFFSFVLKETGEHKRKDDIKKNFIKNFPSLDNPVLAIGNDLLLRELTKLAETSFRVDRQVSGLFKKRRKKYTSSDNIANYLVRFLEDFPAEIGAGLGRKEPRLTVYCNEFVVKTIVWKNKGGYHVVRKQFYTTLNISVSDNHDDAIKLLEPVYLIVAALKQIKNTSITIEDISKGSLNIELEVRSNDLVAKEELKVALETAKIKLLEGFNKSPLLVTSANAQKAEAKADIEFNKLRLEAISAPNVDEARVGRKLDNERKRIENEILKAQLAEMKLKAIKKVSKLIRKGVVQSDQLSISLNGILYLLKDGDAIREAGPDIADIT